jgi:hypothetical protein
MAKKLLKREAERIALTRMEDAARTQADFEDVIVEWNRLDRNRISRERYNEVSRPNAIMLHWDKINPNHDKGIFKDTLEVVLPAPFKCHWWRQLLAGDYIDFINCTPDDMWNLVEYEDVSKQLKQLTDKQKEVIYLRVVQARSTTKISNMLDKTDRAIRKLYVSTINKLQDKLAVEIRKQLNSGSNNMTFDKRVFLSEYDDYMKLNKKAKKNHP